MNAVLSLQTKEMLCGNLSLLLCVIKESPHLELCLHKVERPGSVQQRHHNNQQQATIAAHKSLVPYNSPHQNAW